jgi:hypothetical protein
MIKRFFILIITLFAFISCSVRGQNINDIWQIESSINYENFNKENREKFKKVISLFKEEATKNTSNWDLGFAQQCQLFRKIYLLEIIDQNEFVSNCIEIYESYPQINEDLSFHSLGYALALKYSGKEEASKKIFDRLLNDSEKQKSTDSNILKVVSSRMLGQKVNIPLDDSTELISQMSMEDLVNTFVGF